jgi:hypothetical protein
VQRLTDGCDRVWDGGVCCRPCWSDDGLKKNAVWQIRHLEDGHPALRAGGGMEDGLNATVFMCYCNAVHRFKVYKYK